MKGRSERSREEERRGGSPRKGKLRHDPKVNQHNPFTHFPKDLNCPICNSCKRNRSQLRSKIHGKPDDLPEPKKFADAVTADHKILNDDDKSREHDRVALIVMDRFTRWLQGYAANSKASDEVVRDMQRFLGPQVKPQHVYTDNSKEFIKAFDELNWPHDTSTPHRPQTNGVVERCVRVVKEGTSCVMVQSGLDENGGLKLRLVIAFFVMSTWSSTRERPLTKCASTLNFLAL